MAATPNDEIAAQASQARPADEIAKQKTGQYQDLSMTTGNTPPPATVNPFKSSGV